MAGRLGNGPAPKKDQRSAQKKNVKRETIKIKMIVFKHG